MNRERIGPALKLHYMTWLAYCIFNRAGLHKDHTGRILWLLLFIYTNEYVSDLCHMWMGQFFQEVQRNPTVASHWDQKLSFCGWSNIFIFKWTVGLLMAWLTAFTHLWGRTVAGCIKFAVCCVWGKSMFLLFFIWAWPTTPTKGVASC